MIPKDPIYSSVLIPVLGTNHFYMSGEKYINLGKPVKNECNN